MSMGVLVSMFMFFFMNVFVVVLVVVVVVVVVVVPVLMAAGMLSITSCCVVLVVDGSNNWHGHRMGNWHWKGNPLVGVHPVQSMADDRGDYRVVTSVASVVETSNAVTPFVGLLRLSVTLLRVEPFLRLVCSWCKF